MAWVGPWGDGRLVPSSKLQRPAELDCGMRLDLGSVTALCLLLFVAERRGSADPLAAGPPSEPLFAESFDGDLTAWEISDPAGFTLVDSGDPGRGAVLEMRAVQPTIYALIRGSESWPAYRLEGEVLFPTDEHNYLGFIYNLQRRGERFDLGSLYIKGNGSYIRVNPRRDWNPARMLYEEYRTPLAGEAAIEIGAWQRFALEVEGTVCHLYVGDMERPQVTFPHFELPAGMAGFKPRVGGAPVWIDNLEARSIERLSYPGPPIPAIDHRPERMVRDWRVLGPLSRTLPELERRAAPGSGGVTVDGVEHPWRPFDTDPRGAVVTARVVDFTGPDTVAYFLTTIEVPPGETRRLDFSTIDDMAVWVNGRFEGYSYADRFAWHDFGIHPDHPPSPYTALPLEEGTHEILVRIRGGRYASGGFFAALGSPPHGP